MKKSVKPCKIEHNTSDGPTEKEDQKMFHIAVLALATLVFLMGLGACYILFCNKAWTMINF